MWSLPDIKRLNEEAASKARQAEIKKLMTGRKKMNCDFCDEVATSRQIWFDIFSDDAKGVLGMCEKCEDEQGYCPEGYFWCDDCQRLFINNYTWENYYHVSDDGEMVCLNCYAKRYVGDPENWISLESVTQEDEGGNESEYVPGIEELTFEQVQKSPHIIAVGGPIPAGLKFFMGVTLDSFSGGRVTGFSSSESSPEGGVGELQDSLRSAKAAGYQEAMLILDGAYQFCVSIGVYVRE